MRIDVTQEDIDGGIRNDCFFCPITIALTRAVPKATGVIVGQAEMVVDIGLNSHFAKTTANVAKFISAYDDGVRVRPLSFDLEFNPPLPIDPSTTPPPATTR